jgi:hypothetical protein
MFQEQLKDKAKGDDEAQVKDEDYCQSLGMASPFAQAALIMSRVWASSHGWAWDGN